MTSCILINLITFLHQSLVADSITRWSARKREREGKMAGLSGAGISEESGFRMMFKHHTASTWKFWSWTTERSDRLCQTEGEKRKSLKERQLKREMGSESMTDHETIQGISSCGFWTPPRNLHHQVTDCCLTLIWFLFIASLNDVAMIMKASYPILNQLKAVKAWISTEAFIRLDSGDHFSFR